MTARECLNVCSAYNLIASSPAIGDEPEQMPSDLSAEGALAWMSWNQGDGNYYFGAVDPLAPKKITNVANMTLWLDGQDRATLLDGSGDPVGDGGAVATWADKSGAGHHFTQGTAVDRPHWHADGYVNFPGSPSTVQLNSGREACAPRSSDCRAGPRRSAMARRSHVFNDNVVAARKSIRVRRRMPRRLAPKSTAPGRCERCRGSPSKKHFLAHPRCKWPEKSQTRDHPRGSYTSSAVNYLKVESNPFASHSIAASHSSSH
jgi:hypothetical protein